MHVKGLKIDHSPVHNACGGGHFIEEKGIEGFLEPAPRHAGPYAETRCRSIIRVSCSITTAINSLADCGIVVTSAPAFCVSPLLPLSTNRQIYLL
jgi:hypothetical protein